jgi:uncharacterized protein YndB with AHSA1/START domain
MTDDGGALAHGTVEAKVVISAPLDTVWQAFSDLEVRDRWFRLPGERTTRSHELDFRIGGEEVARSVFAGTAGPEKLEHRSRFVDIARRERITTTYEFQLNGVLRIVALVTVRFVATPEGTLVDYLEQFQFPNLVGDGTNDRAERQGGTRMMLRKLKIVVEESLTE